MNFSHSAQEKSEAKMAELTLNSSIELNITGTLPPAGNLKPNLKASPSLFTHAKSTQSVNHDINTRVWGFKKNIGSLSKGSVPVTFISMNSSSIPAILVSLF
jgi:hypothetical protein